MRENTEMITITFNTKQEQQLLSKVWTSAGKLLTTKKGKTRQKGMLKFWTLEAYDTYLRFLKTLPEDEREALQARFEEFCAQKNHRKTPTKIKLEYGDGGRVPTTPAPSQSSYASPGKEYQEG